MTDADVIQQINEGGVARERSTQQIFQQYQGLIFIGHHTYDLSLQAAADVYADSIAMLIYQINIASFRSEAKISTYLYRIYCNRCCSYLRDELIPNRVEFTDEFPPLTDQALDPYRSLQVRDRVSHLAATCHHLGHHCHQIVWDSWLGYSSQEIADRTGLKSASTVSTMKHRYIAKLRRLVG